MRTMKKVLALSLVLAMALGMMANAATFNDNDAINPDLLSDINLMIALNVFSEQGTGAGYFEPNRELTREEVAKLVYVLKNKGNDNGAASWTGMNIFKDVEAGRWSEGYINYCASTGMIAGTGEGYFNPTAKMSAVEVAKLMLVLGGYKADVQGYLGNNWDINVIRDAEAAGIFGNYELPVRGSVTREWVARILVNGINATKVKYEDGQAQEQYDLITKKPVTFANTDLGLVETVGTLVATNNVKLGANPENNTNGKNVYSVLDADGNTATTNDQTNFKYDAAIALLGQKVTVLSKGTLDNNAKVYGVTTHSDVNVVNTTIGGIKVESINDEPGNVNVTVNGDTKKYSIADNKLVVYTDYAPASASAAINDANLFGTGVKAGANDNRVVKLIDNNGDGIYEAAFIRSATYAKVDYINPSRHIFRANKVEKFAAFTNVSTKEAYEDLVFEDSVAKGDIVKITVNYESGEKKTVIQKADVVTGPVTSVKNGAATIDGVSYGKHVLNGTALTVNAKAMDYYTDGKYIIYSEAPSSSNQDQSNIAYVVNAKEVRDEWGNPTNKVDILKNDGTRETLEYKAYTSNKPTGYLDFSNDLRKGKLVEYVMSGGKVYFKDLATVSGGDLNVVTTDNAAMSYDKSEKKLTYTKSASQTVLTNDETYFFVKSENNQYAVVKASEIKGDFTTVAGTFQLAYAKDGLPYVAYAVIDLGSKTLPGNESTTNVMAIAGSAVTETLDKDGNKVYQLTVTKLDGTEVVLENTTDSEFKSVLNKFVKYSVATDGTATVSPANPDGYTDGKLTAVDGKTVYINGTIYTLADDVKAYYVDSFERSSDGKKRTTVSVGEGYILSAEDEHGTAYNSIKFKADDGKITHIIMEIDGETLFDNDDIA